VEGEIMHISETIPLFIISVGISIILHELAHFLAARMVKCKVEVVSLFFGRGLIKKKIGETIYQIGWIPLGGYCKLKDELTYSRSKYSFTNLPYRHKVFISFAGCAINILLGLITMLVSFIFQDFYLV
jgi:regulator of sigma E protease